MIAKQWFALFVAGGLIGFISPATGSVQGQTPSLEAKLEAKIAELEKRIKDLEAKQKPEPPSAPILPAAASTPAGAEGAASVPATIDSLNSIPSPAGANADVPAGTGLRGLAAPAFAGFQNPFSVRSADGQHELRFTGQIQFDYRDYPRHGDTTDIDTFLLRRARFGLEADVFKIYEFRFLPDFGNGSTVIQDAFMNIHQWNEFQLTVGKFKEPVSFEQLIQDRFVPTLERSLVDQIVPARDLGMMVHGEGLFANQVDYAIGVFNGEVNDNTVDTNRLRDYAGRIVWRPLKYSGLPDWLQPLQIGVSGTTGKEQEPINFNGSSTPNVIRTPGNIPWLTFNSTVRADGIRTRLTPELSYVYGSFGFASQYMWMDQDMRSGVPTITTVKTKTGSVTTITDDPIQDIRFDAYYLMATYLLTGEQKKAFSLPVIPSRPFDPLHPFANPGAWELVTRVSHMQVNPSIFQSGNLFNLAKARGNSDAATEVTVGFNWYLNALVRIQFNWEHDFFQQPVLLGPPTNYFRQADALQLRFQVIF